MDRELALWGKFVFKTTAEIGEKLVAFEEWFQTILQTFGPCRVVLEKPLARKGNVTQRHAEVIGIVRKLWRQHADKEILDSWFIAATTIKRIIDVKRGKDHEANKRLMVQRINQLYGLKLRFHPNSRLQSDDDIADAIAVLVTYWRLNARTPKGQAP